MKKYILIVIIGLVIAGGVSASWWSDFFGTEELGKASTIYQPNILPEADSTYDLGSSAVRWANIYGDTLYGDGSNLTGITVTGGWATSSSDYWLTIQDTADLTEGTNLYYTDARVGEYIDASTTMPVGDWNTAFGWGDHSLAGYYAAADYNTDWDALYNATSTFSGDLSISGNSTTTGYMYVGEDLTVNNQTSTSTINIYSEAADFGGSIIKEKEDGSGCTEQWSGSDGLEYFSDVSCP